MGRLVVAFLTCAVAVPAGLASDDADRARSRGQAFWQGLAGECSVPPGETAGRLVDEAVALLGSPDPFWRDDVGYGVVASCVYQKRALGRAERRALVLRLSANLQQGLGESGTDSVLRRSFSALDLSLLAALELEERALDEAGYRDLLDEALAYLRDERDLRGLEPRLGWVHATAHTADLLKFLARDPRFAPADQARVLEAVFSKATARGTPVFTHAEDERLAAALGSIVRRADLDKAGFRRWLDRFPPLEAEVWSVSPPRKEALDAAQNARNLLRGLFVALSLPGPPARPGTAVATPEEPREAVLQVLQKISR